MQIPFGSGKSDLADDSYRLILGLNYSGVHDSAVALVNSTGEVLYGCALERLTRVKQDSRPPDQLLAAVPWDRIEAIAVSTDEAPWAPVDPCSKLHPTPLTTPRREILTHGQPFYDYMASLPKPRRFVCHHASHAACAFWLSGFDDALCLTYDGGMFNSPWFGGLYHASRTEGIDALDRFSSSHYAKITSLYSIVTALLGFTPNKHEGKITGLAAYGTPNDRIRGILTELYTVDYLKMESVAEWFHAYSKTYPAVLSVHPARKAELLTRFEGHSREDVAATLQAMAEEHVVDILGRARDLDWRSDAICLSGGLFANVKINQRVKEFGFRKIFIAPPMTDDGTALGAALAVASGNPTFSPKPRAHVFLGPQYNSEQIQGALQDFGLRFTKIESPGECLAEHLSRGAVIGIFQGRMEFGPRALGNRSIISQATDPGINGLLNARLRRTEFMPFAPITRVEDAQNCYIGLEGAEYAAEFMTITCQCSETMRAQSPAVVHVDGTARPQLVRRETQPLIHAILSAYKRRTGIPSVINTSFNVHEEPIVCSPSDAIRGFLETGIDFLYLEGGFLVSFEENLAPAVECMRHALAQPSQKEQRLASEIMLFAHRDAGLSAELGLKDVQLKERAALIAELGRIAEERLSNLNTVHEHMEALRGEANSRERGLHELTAIIAAREVRIGELEQMAEERLSKLNTVHQHMEALRGESEVRERGLHELTAIIAARDARIAELERIAEERLSKLNTVHQHVEALRSDSDARDRGLHELTSVITARDVRIAELERLAEEQRANLNTAQEHLDGEAEARERGLHELTSVIATRDARIAELERTEAERLSRFNTVREHLDYLRGEADARERSLQELTAIIAERDARMAALDQVAEERLRAITRAETSLAEATALQKGLSTHLLALERETLVEYLTRRVRKLKVS